MRVIIDCMIVIIDLLAPSWQTGAKPAKANTKQFSTIKQFN